MRAGARSKDEVVINVANGKVHKEREKLTTIVVGYFWGILILWFLCLKNFMHRNQKICMLETFFGLIHKLLTHENNLLYDK